jgi:hypothetical protein
LYVFSKPRHYVSLYTSQTPEQPLEKLEPLWRKG